MRFFLLSFTVVFITLKLLEKIDWSWWLVLAPFIVHTILIFMGICIISYQKVKADEARRNFRKKLK